MFKLAIEVCFENHFGLIHAIFLSLGSTKSGYFFLGHPVVDLEHQWSAAIKEPLSTRVLCRHVAMSDYLKIKLGLRKRKYVFTLQQMN